MTGTALHRALLSRRIPNHVINGNQPVVSGKFSGDALDRIPSLSDADLLQAFHRFVDLEAAACERCERTHSYAGSDNGLHAQNQHDRQATLRLREACAAELMARRLHA
jgi:hypothetical protein